MNKKEKEKLLKEISILLDISDSAARSFLHKVLELKERYKDELEQYTRILGVIQDQPLNITFEMRNKDGTWGVSIPGCPGFDNRIIPYEIVEHIANNALNPGIIKMVKDFETRGERKFDFSFEMQKGDYITGSISEKETREKTGRRIPIEEGSSNYTKLGNLKTFNAYLLNNEKLCNSMLEQFYETWKPLIDSEFINEG